MSVRQMLMAQKVLYDGQFRDSKNSKDVGAVYACSRRGKVKASEMDQISEAFGHLSCVKQEIQWKANGVQRKKKLPT